MAVRLAPAAKGKESVTIVWVVLGPDGNQLGVTRQTKDVRKGSLGKTWGKAADAAAEHLAERPRLAVAAHQRIEVELGRFVVGCADAEVAALRGRLEPFEYESAVTGTRREAQVYLPPGYRGDRTYPVLYLLHGIGGDETEWQRFASPDVLLDNLIADGKAVPMIVVMTASETAVGT